MDTPRHQFYETPNGLTLSVFDPEADPKQIIVKIEPWKLTYRNGDKTLTLQPLKGQVDPDKCRFNVGNIKVEIYLHKVEEGKWETLVGNAPDLKPREKDWESIATSTLNEKEEKTAEEDPNVGGDTAVNAFFQKIFADADDDTKRAMVKSFQESGGTTLSTNWEDVKRAKVEPKPPAGSEWKKWN